MRENGIIIFLHVLFLLLTKHRTDSVSVNENLENKNNNGELEKEIMGFTAPLIAS